MARGTRAAARAAAGAVLLAASIGLSTLLVPDAAVCLGRGVHGSIAGSVRSADGMRPHGMDEVMTGPTCNQVEMAAPSTSTYVPDVAGASVADRAKAQELLEGVNEFCRSHSAATLTSQWRPGLSGQSPTHFFNPDPRSGGLDPANPRAALIYDGELGGVMFTGKPLPSLGSIPRAHNHEASTVEMVHVYCTTSLKEAFTPNRVLGVKADQRKLRLRIRPAVMDHDEAQLRAVLAKVRGYTGNRFQVPGQVEPPPGGGRPDPVLRAMRTEIRTSLFILTEVQLRSVWTLMRSSHARRSNSHEGLAR